MFDWLRELFGTVLRFFNDITGSYLLAIILFAIVTKVLLFPFSIKQQRNSVKQASLRPKEMAIRKKYKGVTDPEQQRKMQAEIQELYQKEGYNPMGGCLPLLLQFPLIILIYNVIRNPLRYICGFESGDVTSVLNAAREIIGNAKITEINLVSALNGEHGSAILESAGVLGKYDLSTLPDFTIFGNFDLSITPGRENLVYIIIPILTGVVSYFSMKLTKKLSYQGVQPEGDGASKMSGAIMDLMMPAMSVWMTFLFPAMLGIYWIFQNILGVVQQLILKKMFPYPQFTEEDYKKAEREMNGKGSKKYKNPADNRPSVKPGTYRSLHNIDDDTIYSIPDKNKKSASEAPKLKDDKPDHRRKS